MFQKKNYIWISSNEVDETGAYYTEWSKPERKTPIQYTKAYIWNLERWYDNPVYETAKETLMYRTVFWTLWEREEGDDLGEQQSFKQTTGLF